MSEGASKALIVGCGFYGVEAALALKAAGLEVTVIEKKKRVMPYFSMTFAEAILAKLREQDITIKLGTELVSAQAQSTQTPGFVLELSNEEQITSDLVVGASASRAHVVAGRCRGGA